MRQLVIVAMLGAAIFVTALQLVLHRFESRTLFVELQELRKHQDDLDREWSQLLLEQGTWGTHGRVEDLARSKLNMTIPSAERIYQIRS